MLNADGSWDLTHIQHSHSLQLDMTLADRVRRTIRHHALAAAGRSVCSWRCREVPTRSRCCICCCELERRGDFVVAGVAHFNHQLRGAEADARRSLLPRAGVRARRCRSRSAAATCATRRGEQGRSIEDAARERCVMVPRTRGRIVLARRRSPWPHPRRSGRNVPAAARARRGTARPFGICPRAGRVIRPLIEISRAELRAIFPRTRAASPARIQAIAMSRFRATVSATSSPVPRARFSPGITRAGARGGARAAGRRLSAARSNRIAPVRSS